MSILAFKVLVSSHFSVLKIGPIFPKKNYVKNIGLGDQLLLKISFLISKYVLYLLKLCTIFVGYVHNFGRSDDDNI